MEMFGGRPPTEIPKKPQPPGTLLFTQIWVKNPLPRGAERPVGAAEGGAGGFFDPNLGKKQGSGGLGLFRDFRGGPAPEHFHDKKILGGVGSLEKVRWDWTCKLIHKL